MASGPSPHPAVQRRSPGCSARKPRNGQAWSRKSASNSNAMICRGRRGPMHSSGNYVFGGGQTELQRLVIQAAGLEAEASWLLDNIPVGCGWRAADIGCGPIGILDLLSQRVGPRGRVVGLEPEPRFADMAAREVERRELRNVRVVRGDAHSPSLEHGSFDFVHERLVLLNMPDTERRRFISQMLSLAKPGGTIALQDYDRVSCVCYPEHLSW